MRSLAPGTSDRGVRACSFRQFDGPAFEVVISDSEGERLPQLESPTELLQHSERVWAGLIDSG